MGFRPDIKQAPEITELTQHHQHSQGAAQFCFPGPIPDFGAEQHQRQDTGRKNNKHDEVRKTPLPEFSLFSVAEETFSVKLQRGFLAVHGLFSNRFIIFLFSFP